MDDFNLNKNNIIITGGGGFLARSFSEKIIQYNGNPILIDNNTEKLTGTKNYLKHKINFNVDTYKCNLSKEESVKKLFGKLKKRYQSLDILINNAAPNPTENQLKKVDYNLDNFSIDTWNNHLNAGLTSAFLCSKYYGKLNNKNQRCVINISSDLGIIAPNQNLYKTKKKVSYKPVTYSVMKHGIIGLTKYCSTFWIEKKIRCNALAFGGVENNQSKEFLNKVNKLIPMGRLAKYNEYDSTLIYMISEASSYMNGSVVIIDGGRTSW